MDSSREDVCSEMGACLPGSSRRGSDSIMMLRKSKGEAMVSTSQHATVSSYTLSF